MSGSDQASEVGFGESTSRWSAPAHPPSVLSSVPSTTKAPKRPKPSPPRPPSTLLEFFDSAIGDWSRTFRLVTLLVTAAVCIAVILFVLQLRADRWAWVVAATTGIIGIAVASRQWKRRRRRLDPPPGREPP